MVSYMKTNDNKFWFFAGRELGDIMEDLKEPLQLPEFSRDYENSWEWYESGHSSGDFYFNMAREQNEGNGRYDCPIILDISDTLNISLESIGERIATTLNVDVYYGLVYHFNGVEYKYKPKKVFKNQGQKDGEI